MFWGNSGVSRCFTKRIQMGELGLIFFLIFRWETTWGGGGGGALVCFGEFKLGELPCMESTKPRMHAMGFPKNNRRGELFTEDNNL
jgi:hypothetical protein